MSNSEINEKNDTDSESHSFGELDDEINSNVSHHDLNIENFPLDFCAWCEKNFNVHPRQYCYKCCRYLCDGCIFTNDSDIYDFMYGIDPFFDPNYQSYSDIKEIEEHIPVECKRSFCNNCEFIENGYILK
jgi:hypothetical protein